MTNTYSKLKLTAHAADADCVYSDVTHQISVYERQYHRLLRVIAISSDDVLCLKAAELSDNRSYPMGIFLATIAPLYPPEAEPVDVPAAVWEQVATSVKMPTRIPEA